MRLFFALWPPVDTARALAQWASEVQRESGGRAAAEETVHLTLAFLGEADEGAAALAAGRVRGKAFEMKVDTAKYWKHNRIVWVGPGTMPFELKSLVESLHGVLRKGGLTLEDRPFAAHVTLVRKANPPQSIPPLPKVEWPTGEFALVRSAGGKYETVQRFPLR